MASLGVAGDPFEACIIRVGFINANNDNKSTSDKQIEKRECDKHLIPIPAPETQIAYEALIQLDYQIKDDNDNYTLYIQSLKNCAICSQTAKKANEVVLNMGNIKTNRVDYLAAEDIPKNNQVKYFNKNSKAIAIADNIAAKLNEDKSAKKFLSINLDISDINTQ